MGCFWFIDHLFLRKSGWEFSDLTDKLCCPHFPPSPSLPFRCPHESAGTWSSHFLLNQNPRGSQYFILTGSKTFKHGIQNVWVVSRGDDFLLNDINPTYPVWNLINTSDRGRKCCSLNELEQVFHSAMCLLLIRSPEMWEEQSPGALMSWDAGGGGGPCREGTWELALPLSWCHSAWGCFLPVPPNLKLHQESSFWVDCWKLFFLNSQQIRAGFSSVYKESSLEKGLQFFFFEHRYIHRLLIYLFIYLWLCWVFKTSHRLSLVGAISGLSSLQCMGNLFTKTNT